jgi:TonB family protein
MIMGTQEPAQATTAQVESPPVPAVETAPVETAPVETPPIDTPPIDTPPPTETPVATPAQQPTQRSTERPAQRSSHASKPAGEPTPRSETKAEPKPVAKPAVEEPVVDDGCDETSCILSKYEKACCEKYKPKTSDLSARTGGGLPEELDKMMVRAGVEKVKPRVVACGEKAAAKGTVRIAMSVSPAGAVTSAEVAETPDAGLGACVLAAMKAASFGKSVNGGTFTYPFAF